MTLWTAPRPWKGKPCHINLRNEDQADLYMADPDGVPDSQWPAYSVFVPTSKAISLNAATLVHTDPRCTEVSVGESVLRLMGEGVMSGLEERRDHLPGRFIVCKAIGLAVHLGASVIHLRGEVPPRALRNLDTMRRPLKGHRVRLIEYGPDSGEF